MGGASFSKILLHLLRPESQSTNTIQPPNEVIMMKYDETYDEIWVKTASKCLGRMKGCWDLEVEPRVEEIEEY